MKLYYFYGSDTTLSDADGEIRLNHFGEAVELDEKRAAMHIANGAPLISAEDWKPAQTKLPKGEQ